MAKLDVAAAIAVLLVSTSASLGLAASASFDLDVQPARARFGYNPDLRTMVQEPLTEDLDVIAKGTGGILGDGERRYLTCVDLLSSNGAGWGCVRSVTDVLVFRDLMTEELTVACCINVLHIDMNHHTCWNFLYDEPTVVLNDVSGLIASCLDTVLVYLQRAPAPAPAPGQ